MLTYQDLDGDLSFALDTWTSPNSRALVAVTIHYEDKGKASTWLLDVIEVAESHTGAALAAAFEKVVTDFGISHKVRKDCGIERHLAFFG